MKIERLSRRELYDIAKQFWGDGFPPFEKFIESGLGMGIQADDDTNLWVIDHIENYINIEVFEWETKRKVGNKILTRKNEQWTDTGWNW